MQSIVNTKGYVAPGLGNSSKQCDSSCAKSANQGRKKVCSTQAVAEHWIYKDVIKYSDVTIKEVVLKCEQNAYNNLNKDVEGEKKESSKSEKRKIE